MALWVRISLGIAAGLVGLFIGAVVILTQTGLGMQLLDRFSRPLIEDLVRQELGSDIQYAGLAGRFPNQLIIRDLELSRDGEVWAEVDRFTLLWDAKDLIRWHLHVREVVLADAALYQIPDFPQRTDTPEPVSDEEQGDGFELPFIRVDSLVVSDFRLGESFLGAPYVFSLSGEGRWRRSYVRTRLTGRTEGDLDRITVNASNTGSQLELDLDLISEAEGLVSQLIDAQGRTELRARATGRLDDLEAALAARSGQYGTIEGTLGASVDAPDRLRADVTISPGPVLPEDARQIVGDTISITAESRYADDTLTLDLERLAGDFGTIGGVISAVFGETPAVTAGLTGVIRDEALSPYGAADFAGSVSLDTAVRFEEDATAVRGALAAGPVEVTLIGGRLTQDIPFAGTIDARLSQYASGNAKLDRLLDKGARARASVQLAANDVLTIRDLSARLGTAGELSVTAQGDAAIGLSGERIDADLGVTASADAVALFAAGLALDGPVALKTNVDGTFSAISVSLRSEIPGGVYGETRFSPGTLSADLTGLPTEPSGSVNLVSEMDDYRAAALISTEGSLYRLEQFVARADGLDISADGSADVDAGSGRVSIDIDARRGFRIPGADEAAGVMRVNAAAEPGLSSVRLELQAEDLRLGADTLAGLRVSAEGPRDAIRFDAVADDLFAAGVFIQNVSTGGTVDAGPGSQVGISAIELIIPGPEDPAIRLREPTTVRWRDGIELEPARFEIFGPGRLEAEAGLTDRRWSSRIAASDIPLPQTEGQIGFELDLDTDRPTPATLDLASEASRGDAVYRIMGDGTWDGQDARASLRILESDGGERGQVSLALPLRLVRTPALSVDVPSSDLDGSLDYEGRLDPILAFTPVAGEPFDGIVTAHVQVSGQTAAPQVDGRVMVSEGRFEEGSYGITLTNIDGGVTFNVASQGTRGEVDITASGLEQRPGSVKVSGSLTQEGLQSSADLAVELDRAQLARNSELNFNISSDLSFGGSGAEYTLAGPVTLNQLEITIPEVEGGDDAPRIEPVNIVRVDQPTEEEPDEPEEPEEDGIATLNLDLRVRSTEDIEISGLGLNSAWQVDLKVSGTADDPVVVGDVDLSRGTLDLAGREFTITTGRAVFRSSDSLNPFVTLRAETEAGDGANSVTAIVEAEGPADDLAFTFSSNPPLPEEDVLALILFGRPANALGASEAIQLAQALATLTGNNPMASVQSGLGLDRLSFDPTDRSLTVGKYVADDILVTARQSFGDVGTVISVIYELSRFVNIETTLEPDGAQTLGANYKRDY